MTLRLNTSCKAYSWFKKCYNACPKTFLSGQGLMVCYDRSAPLVHFDFIEQLNSSKSLKTSLSHLQSPETAPLLKNAIFASISLTTLTTSVSPGSKPTSERFDQLSSLLGEGIISGIWLYAEDKPDVIKATFDTLPRLLRALGIGSVRFLKVCFKLVELAAKSQPMSRH